MVDDVSQVQPGIPPEAKHPLNRSAVIAVVAAGVAGLVALGIGAAVLLRPPFTMPGTCEAKGPRLAAEMENFLRANSGDVLYGQASVVICDSVPGVTVSLPRQTGAVELTVLYEALSKAGCDRVEDEFASQLRSCPLRGGKKFGLEVGRSDARSGSPAPGESFTVSGSTEVG